MVSEHLSPLFQSLGPIRPSEKSTHPAHPVNRREWKGGRMSQRTRSRTQCLPQALGYSEMRGSEWVLWMHFVSLGSSSSYSPHTSTSSRISRAVLLLKTVVLAIPIPSSCSPPFPHFFIFSLSPFFSVGAGQSPKSVSVPLLFNTERERTLFWWEIETLHLEKV